MEVWPDTEWSGILMGGMSCPTTIKWKYVLVWSTRRKVRAYWHTYLDLVCPSSWSLISRWVGKCCYRDFLRLEVQQRRGEASTPVFLMCQWVAACDSWVFLRTEFQQRQGRTLRPLFLEKFGFETPHWACDVATSRILNAGIQIEWRWFEWNQWCDVEIYIYNTPVFLSWVASTFSPVGWWSDSLYIWASLDM